MATSGDGTLAFIESPGQLADLYASELQGLVTTVGKRVSIGIRAKNGAELVDVLNDLDATEAGNDLFVHAGVRPGVPLEEQAKDDLIWIRMPFLSRPHGLPYTVVHGHSITKDHQIERRPGRINLDTGAFSSGVLSSLRLGARAVRPPSPAWSLAPETQCQPARSEK